MKILFCAAEVVPFAKTGGLADVAGALPKSLAALGHDVRIVLPKYGSIDEKRFQLQRIIDRLVIPVAGKEVSFAVWESKAIAGVTTYFIDNCAYFGEGSLYGQANDDERFILYQYGILAMLAALKWQPEVMHCNDWQTGLLPLKVALARENQQPLGKVATIYTVHNLAYQGHFSAETLKKAGLPESLFVPDKLEFYGGFNFMKAGMLYADLITTVSPTYAKEIQTQAYGERLEGLLAWRSKRLRGILNGIDYEIWDPANDKLIASPYGATTPAGKAACKKDLQKKLKLAQAEVPIIGAVSRLAAQKGFDLLGEILPELLALGAQLVVLGVGEKPYEDLLSQAAKQYPKQVSLTLKFDEALAHQIYAGSDMFLMPSRYEPCGLGQLISLRYGTIPVVRTTGGLADTVVDFDSAADAGTGFQFSRYSPVALLGAVSRSLLAYQDKAAWKGLVTRALKQDFSWQSSAGKYEALYREAVKLKGK
jgi:starch synthase